jgi:peptide/nickel transport system substrate-binding protein
MTPNPYYPDAEKRSDVTIKVFKDMSAMKLAVESGEIEMASTITADVKQMLEAEGVKVQTIDAGYQYYLDLNQERGFIKDIAVRKALNLAIDRNVLIQALKGGRPASGIFARYYSFAGDDEPVFDLEQARKTLDNAGWKLNAEGIREKDGKKLSLKMITYTARPDLPVMMQIISSQIKELGIDITSNIVGNINEACKAGDFDLCLYAQHTAPTGDPAYFMVQKYFKSSPNNFSRYISDEFEAIVNKMGDLPHGEQRDELSRKAQDLLLKDLPVIFLIDPQWHIAVSDRLKNYKPYCGDYYTVNEKLGMP